MINRGDYYTGIGLLAGLLLLGDFGLRHVGASQPAIIPQIIRAREFQMVDGRGKVRARLYFAGEHDSTPSLVLMDESKRPSATLSGNARIPELSLFSHVPGVKASSSDATFSAGPDPSVSLDLGKACVFDDVDAVYGGHIMLHDQHGQTSLSLPEAH